MHNNRVDKNIIYKNKIYKSILLVILTVVLGAMLLILTACKNEEAQGNEQIVALDSSSKTTENVNNVNTESGNNTKKEERVVDTIDYKSAVEKQMALPEKGETIAIIHVKNFGDVKVKFFEDVAPKAVENFITHAKEGYYDGLIFHRVIDEFMIQGGDPEGTGYGGESIWGEGFGTELDYNLVPYRGSLCMAMSSAPNSIGSQFFITQAHYSEKMESNLKTMGYPSGLLEQYEAYGGYLSLYLQYTVFGQVYEGIEVVDAIAGVATNSSDKPLEDVVIESIEVKTY